jgi:uncharacterized membrane protein
MNESTASAAAHARAQGAAGATRFFRRLLPGYCNAGMLLGALFVFASLTPSLIPRAAPEQAALSGACFAIGYGLGVLLRWLWRYLEIPLPRVARHPRSWQPVLLLSAVIVVLGLWWGQDWDGVLRKLMGIPPSSAVRILVVGLGALVVGTLFIVLGRGVWLLLRAGGRMAQRALPRRVANVLGVIATGVLLVMLLNGVVIRFILSGLEASFAARDSLIAPEVMPPTEVDRSGSPASLVRWNELGRMGRRYISTGPTAEEISAFTGKPAMRPLRVYVGLAAADTPADRAHLALEELKRIGGFERSVLVLITPTGTGWVDPGGIDSIEYLTHGDVASVAAQYSYLNSPLTMFVDPYTGREMARALFREIYGYWHTLPRDKRPKLYLHGLSLGAQNSEWSFEFFELMGDPIDGALWVGPPWTARYWRAATEARNPGTPAWRPQFGDSSFVRFMNQQGSGAPHGATWGPMRIVYLQYASDAITFFNEAWFFREPDWLQPPRGLDVSAKMRWYPVVTMLQTAMDMPLSMNTPLGFGHAYAPTDYLAAWIEVTGRDDWTPQQIARLKQHLEERRRAGIESQMPGG